MVPALIESRRGADPPSDDYARAGGTRRNDFDRLTRGHVHRVYVITLAIFVVAFCRILLMEKPLWMAVGRTLLSPSCEEQRTSNKPT